MEISCWSFIRMAKLAEPLMERGGTLFCMSYYGSQMVVEHYNLMGPVKAALESATRYLAAELGPKGIRVHAISPGPLTTRAASGIGHFDELLAKAQAKAPMRSLVSIDDVGLATAYLATDAARPITGRRSMSTAATTSSTEVDGDRSTNMTDAKNPAAAAASAPPGPPAAEYGLDAWQRSVLFRDVLRQRGNQYLRAQASRRAACAAASGRTGAGRPHADAAGELRAGADHPARRASTVDPRKRPFVIVDPRAGHGPGIGGFKDDSEVGVALRAGHPVLLRRLLPRADAGPDDRRHHALPRRCSWRRCIALHPDADGKPVRHRQLPGRLGGDDAGRDPARAVRPDHRSPARRCPTGPACEGENPMRYAGGLLGGTWLSSLAADLGDGKFDGAHLVQNFENLNPVQHALGQVLQPLRQGRHRGAALPRVRAAGGAATSSSTPRRSSGSSTTSSSATSCPRPRSSPATGGAIDLRNISSPIICFCSMGDNITPPQQAFDWIADLYGSVDDISACGQTIVYAVHENDRPSRHLRLGRGGEEGAPGVRLQHRPDRLLPPGLYEAVLTPVGKEPPVRRDRVGDYVVRFEQRTLDDIRALGCNDLEDERKFAAVARLSEINLGLYRTFLQPWVRAVTTDQSAQLLRRLSSSRLQFELFSDQNPFMQPIAAAADLVRANRRPASADNPLLAPTGVRVAADRGGSGRLPRLARCHGRGELPCHLRLAAD